jgi:hypothetical protein
MTGYVISREFGSVSVFATTHEGQNEPEHYTPILHFALAYRHRHQAARAMHAGGWHRHGWRVEPARRYRLGVQ